MNISRKHKSKREFLKIVRFLASQQDRTVCQVLPSLDSGGVERGTIEIARFLMAQKQKNMVISSGGRLEEDLKKLGVEHICLPVHSKNPFVMISTAYKLHKLFVAKNVGVVHVRSRAPAWTVKLALCGLRIPMLTTFHGTYGLKPAPFKRWYNQVMVSGDLVIAVSEHIARHITENYKIDSNKIRLIPRGADAKTFDVRLLDKKKVDALKKEWGVEKGKTVLLLPGRRTKIKGHVLVMEALKKMKHKDVQCFFVGSDQGRTDYTNFLKDKIKELGLQKQVKLIDHCADMLTAYGAADITISATTKPEAFGRTVPEAQLVKCLVIAANHGGAAETIKHGKTGFHFKPNDSDDLARQLDALLSLPEKRKEFMRNVAQKEVLKKYTVEAMCKKTWAVYQELMK